MAEKDDISKGAADNLQRAAQALSKVSEKMERVFSKGADFAKAMTLLKEQRQQKSTLLE